MRPIKKPVVIPSSQQPPERFEIGGYYLSRQHIDRGGSWYACRYDARTGSVRRRSLGTTDFEQAKIKLATLVAAAPQGSGTGVPNPDVVLTTAVLESYVEDRGPHIASEEQAERAVQLITEYLRSIGRVDAMVSFWTPSQQLEFAKWCVAEYGHSAGYVERLFNVMRSAFNAACEVKIRIDAVGNKIEAAILSHAPKVVWKREKIARELKIPAEKRKPRLLSIEEMGLLLDHLQAPHLFRFAIIELCTWVRPQAVIDLDPKKQVDWSNGSIDFKPEGWVPTNKRRPNQPLSECLAGWLNAWEREDAAWRVKDIEAGREPRPDALIVYKRRRVATVKRAIRRISADLGLIGFSQYGFRHFMADEVKKLFRIPRELRSRWLGHVVKDGSPTTTHYERDDPHELSDVALAVDCIMALLQEHCTRPLFSPSAPWMPCGRPSFTADKLRTRKELERIGARLLPKTHKKQ
jgi:integrase